MTQRRNKQKEKRRFPLAKRHRYVAWAGVTVCCGFWVVGILFFVGGIREWQIESASVNWPIAEAEVTQSQVVADFILPLRWGTVFTENVRKVSVRYIVNAKEYTAELKLPVGATAAPNASSRHDLLFPPGNTEHIGLYYSPDNPREVLLHPGDEVAAAGVVCVGTMLTAVFSIAIFGMVRGLTRPGANG